MELKLWMCYGCVKSVLWMSVMDVRVMDGCIGAFAQVQHVL